jgi:hypothetical protein
MLGAKERCWALWYHKEGNDLGVHHQGELFPLILEGQREIVRCGGGKTQEYCSLQKYESCGVPRTWLERRECGGSSSFQ